MTSPYDRTQQTAAPTIARFSGVPVEIWPIEEFTYLRPARWNGSTRAERMPHIERYWRAADPEFCDGEGAESFGALLRRCEAALARLAALPAGSLAYVFGHGQFIQAARAIIQEAHLDDRGKMRAFWREDGSPAIANAQRLEFRWMGGFGPARPSEMRKIFPETLRRMRRGGLDLPSFRRGSLNAERAMERIGELGKLFI